MCQLQVFGNLSPYFGYFFNMLFPCVIIYVYIVLKSFYFRVQVSYQYEIFFAMLWCDLEYTHQFSGHYVVSRLFKTRVGLQRSLLIEMSVWALQVSGAMRPREDVTQKISARLDNSLTHFCPRKPGLHR